MKLNEKWLANAYISRMSRAFVNEDQYVEDLPDRPVSGHPNYVTPRGLQLIEAALDQARRNYGEAQAAGDREALVIFVTGTPAVPARRFCLVIPMPSASSSEAP